MDASPPERVPLLWEPWDRELGGSDRVRLCPGGGGGGLFLDRVALAPGVKGVVEGGPDEMRAGGVTHTHTHTRVHTHTHTHTDTHTHTHTHAQIHAHTHTHTHKQIHTHTHTWARYRFTHGRTHT